MRQREEPKRLNASEVWQEHLSLSSSDEGALSALLADVPNVVGPLEGRASFVDNEGNEVPARGVPGVFYALAISAQTVTLPPEVSPANKKHAYEVCGKWAGQDIQSAVSLK